MAITVTPTVEASNVPPRVRLNITASAGELTTVPTRTDPDGSIVDVRTSDGNPLAISAGTALLYDYEAPFGQAVTYSSLETPANVSVPVTVPASQVWLTNPGVPALSMPVTLRPGTLQEETYSVAQSVYVVMGRANPVVVTDGVRKGAQSTLVVVTQTLDELSSVKALVADASTLLLNIPPGLGIGFGTCYIAVGEVRVSRWTDVVIDGYRDVVLPFNVVDRPVGGSQAQRTWAAVTSAYATWAGVVAAYPTWTDVLSGP